MERSADGGGSGIVCIACGVVKIIDVGVIHAMVDDIVMRLGPDRLRETQ